jgi:hypothetical protein
MLAPNDTTTPTVIGLSPIAIILEVIPEHRGSAVVANSALIDGRRTIIVKLCRSHPLVSRSLAGGDSALVRFLVGLALTEFCLFWGGGHDGSSVRNEFKRMAGIPPGDRAWGSSFASALANCEALKIVDGLPIYGPNPERGPFHVLAFAVALKSPSDIPRWRGKGEKAKHSGLASLGGLPVEARSGEMPEHRNEPVRRECSPPGPVTPPAPSPRSLRRAERRQSAAEVVTVPVTTSTTSRALYLDRFHQVAKEMLSPADLAVLEEMAKGAVDV